jgi:hypothetical protein
MSLVGRPEGVYRCGPGGCERIARAAATVPSAIDPKVHHPFTGDALVRGDGIHEQGLRFVVVGQDLQGVVALESHRLDEPAQNGHVVGAGVVGGHSGLLLRAIP